MRLSGRLCRPSVPLHEGIQHALLAGLVEIDGQLVAVDRADAAIAEFLVEDALADRIVAGAADDALGDQFALDQARAGGERDCRSRAWPSALSPLFSRFFCARCQPGVA